MGENGCKSLNSPVLFCAGEEREGRKTGRGNSESKAEKACVQGMKKG